jgi:hypothetical protein
MRHWVAGALLCVAGLLAAAESGETTEALLTRIKAKMEENLTRVPDYTCFQTVDRWGRHSPDAELEQMDTLRLEVGFIGDKEVFSWQGASKFQEKQLADMIGAGTVGTGSFAIHASNVFLTDAPEFTYKGEETLDGRRAIRFEYNVSRALSRYKLRVSRHQAVVGFHGSLWVDRETLDLIRLEVRAHDIPPELQLARASDVMEYQRVPIGQSDFLLPRSSELTMVWVYGQEHRNRRQLSRCRQYVAGSRLSFGEDPADSSPPKPETARLKLPPDLPMRLSLDGDIRPETAAIGDPIRAVLSRPLLDGDRMLAPEGAVALGRLVRLEKYEAPIPHYVVGLEFHTLRFQDVETEFSATMEDAGPASGLIRQAKRLMPTFTRKRAPRFDILVRERPRGQGVLHWKAKNKRIRRGLRMRWRTDPPQ